MEKFLKSKGIYILIILLFVLGISFLKFRNPTLDDDLYVFETSIMAQALSRGEWIGYYAGGIHGFIFKLPVALIFLFTGPSLLIGTVWNILLSCFVLYLFYLFLKKYFGDSLIPLAGTILLGTNFQFLLNYPTYMREIPVILSLILFLYLLIHKKSYWLVGLALLLVLDAKETVFFMIMPSLSLFLLIFSWKGFKLTTLKEFLKKYVKVLLPSLAYILLMVFTSIIPLNTVIFTVVPGVTEGGVEFQLQHFKFEFAIENLFKRKDPEAKTIEEVIPVDIEQLPSSSFLKTVLGYVGKVLYPRSFSWVSIPKVIFFPALLASILLFKNALKKKDETFILLALILWSYFMIFVLRSSYDRYLFPISGVVFFFFLLFLKEFAKNKMLFFLIFSLSSVFAFLGLVFETEYIEMKLILNLVVVVAYIFYLFFNEKFKNALFFLTVFLGSLTFCVISYFFYANGQYRQYVLWGREYGVHEVIKHFDEDEKILINDIGWDLLIGTYRGNRHYAAEWHWPLQEWVPRKKHLRAFDEFNTYTLQPSEFETDRIVIQEYGIEKVALVISEVEGIEFPFTERLPLYLEANWLELESEVALQNKTLYIFKVVLESED